MFLQVSVCPQRGGGMRGCSAGGEGGVGYDEIRSMSGRYASYWNAFLLRSTFTQSNRYLTPYNNRRRNERLHQHEDALGYLGGTQLGDLSQGEQMLHDSIFITRCICTKR